MYMIDKSTLALSHWCWSLSCSLALRQMVTSWPPVSLELHQETFLLLALYTDEAQAVYTGK